jgi:hypothetical protein
MGSLPVLARENSEHDDLLINKRFRFEGNLVKTSRMGDISAIFRTDSFPRFRDFALVEAF